MGAAITGNTVFSVIKGGKGFVGIYKLRIEQLIIKMANLEMVFDRTDNR
jgi:hypothetical protein